MAKTVSILLADDDPEDQDILKEYLLEENPGLSIHCVFNGKEVISRLNSSTEDELPSLIILDYKMPILNAVQTLEQIGENERYSAIPKVVWSTSDRDEHKKRCLETGAVHYFSKPISRIELARVASHMLKILFNGRAKIQ